jgi:hypothetical protein
MSTDKSLDILDAIYRDAALVEAEHGASTADDRRWAKDLRARLKERIAEKRRALLPATSAVKKARPIRPWILAMVYDELVARIGFLTKTGVGSVQVAHRNLSGLSLDDLRQILNALEPDPTSED